MRLIILGCGYIGSRLLTFMKRMNEVEGLGLDISGVDLRFYDAYPPGIEFLDAFDLPAGHFKDAVVISTISPHRIPEPEDPTDRPKILDVYNKLNVQLPGQILDDGPRALILFSSMRALTEVDIYSESKRAMESAFINDSNVLILRPGTVWGDLRPGFPNRFNTAVNAALINSKFDGNHWSAYTTYIATLKSNIFNMLTRDILVTPMSPLGEVLNLVDDVAPMTAIELRGLLTGQHADLEFQRCFDLERAQIAKHDGAYDTASDNNAQQRFATYYRLPEKKAS